MRGRTTTTVRFTAARLAGLRAAAASEGRSLSEEIEYRIERDARADASTKRISPNCMTINSRSGGTSRRTGRLKKS